MHIISPLVAGIPQNLQNDENLRRPMRQILRNGFRGANGHSPGPTNTVWPGRATSIVSSSTGVAPVPRGRIFIPHHPGVGRDAPEIADTGHFKGIPHKMSSDNTFGYTLVDRILGGHKSGTVLQ